MRELPEEDKYPEYDSTKGLISVSPLPDTLDFSSIITRPRSKSISEGLSDRQKSYLEAALLILNTLKLSESLKERLSLRFNWAMRELNSDTLAIKGSPKKTLEKFLERVSEIISFYSGLSVLDVWKRLIKAEMLVAWDKKRSTIRNPFFGISTKEEPMLGSLTSVQMEEIFRIYGVDPAIKSRDDEVVASRDDEVVGSRDEESFWFEEQEPWVRDYLKEKFQPAKNLYDQNKQEDALMTLREIYKTVPSSFRVIPGLANLGQHTVVVGKFGLTKSIYRSANPVPDIKDDGEALRLTQQNIYQLFEGETSPGYEQAVAYLKRLGDDRLAQIKEDDTIEIPIVLQSLISPGQPGERKLRDRLKSAISKIPDKDLGKTVMINERVYRVKYKILHMQHPNNCIGQLVSAVCASDIFKENQKMAKDLLRIVIGQLVRENQTKDVGFLRELMEASPLKEEKVFFERVAGAFSKENFDQLFENASEPVKQRELLRWTAIQAYGRLMQSHRIVGIENANFLCLLEMLISQVLLAFCKSGKDRTSQPITYLDSFLACVEEGKIHLEAILEGDDPKVFTPWLPELDEKYNHIYNSHHHQAWAEYNAPGSSGIKNLCLILCKRVLSVVSKSTRKDQGGLAALNRPKWKRKCAARWPNLVLMRGKSDWTHITFSRKTSVLYNVNAKAYRVSGGKDKALLASFSFAFNEFLKMHPEEKARGVNINCPDRLISKIKTIIEKKFPEMGEVRLMLNQVIVQKNRSRSMSVGQPLSNKQQKWKGGSPLGLNNGQTLLAELI
jgi:hypothetical protein